MIPTCLFSYCFCLIIVADDLMFWRTNCSLLKNVTNRFHFRSKLYEITLKLQCLRWEDGVILFLLKSCKNEESRTNRGNFQIVVFSHLSFVPRASRFRDIETGKMMYNVTIKVNPNYSVVVFHCSTVAPFLVSWRVCHGKGLLQNVTLMKRCLICTNTTSSYIYIWISVNDGLLYLKKLKSL